HLEQVSRDAEFLEGDVSELCVFSVGSRVCIGGRGLRHGRRGVASGNAGARGRLVAAVGAAGVGAVVGGGFVASGRGVSRRGSPTRKEGQAVSESIRLSTPMLAATVRGHRVSKGECALAEWSPNARQPVGVRDSGSSVRRTP